MFIQFHRVVVAGVAATLSAGLAVANSAPAQAAGVPAQCATGRVVCVNKATQRLTLMVDGQAELRMAVRFGDVKSPTRDGTFRIFRKDAEHVSSITGEPMPYAMFFSGGQAIHYSEGFVRRGYKGASRGCVNTRDLPGTLELFKALKVGDKVHVYGKLARVLPPGPHPWWYD